jgi:hypothetical protein
LSGNFHPQSDIDLAFLPTIPYSFSTFDRLSLSARLQDELSYEIDIGIMETHDVIYAALAILHGHCIFSRDRYQEIDIEILHTIAGKGWEDFVSFCEGEVMG